MRTEIYEYRRQTASYHLEVHGEQSLIRPMLHMFLALQASRATAKDSHATYVVLPLLVLHNTET